MELKFDTARTQRATIPSDWKVRPLAAIAERITVGIASAATHAYRSKGVPLLRNQNIKPGFLDDRDVLFIDPHYEASFRNKRLKAGDLITARTGYPGITCVITERYESAQSFTTLITRPNKGRVDGAYLCHFINSEIGQQFFEQSQFGGAQQNVNAATLRSMPITVPPLPEQRVITAALSDVNALLAKLDQLIDKKRDLKQAAMQELLTGKTRLPRFNDQWHTKLLGEVGVFKKGKGIRKDEVARDGLPCIRYGEIYTRHNDYVKTFHSFITRGTARQSQPIAKGDLLFAGSGETAEEIGKCVAFLDDHEAYAGGDIVIFSPREESSMFLGYLLNHPVVSNQKARMGQGDAVVHISAKNLAQLELRLPNLDEQTAIAGVLWDMDAEIAALEARRNKTRALKQGMMQELLTGRIRLVEPVPKVNDAKMRQTKTEETAKDHRNWAFNEAVVIAVLAQNFADATHPLGRLRYTKLSYLLHRYTGENVDGYLKKAAGPYNPSTRYEGPERIAQTSGYVQPAQSGKRHGFLVGEHIGKARAYFDKWYGPAALEWLKQFHYEKNEVLELLTTVDTAIEELRLAGNDVTVASVKGVLIGEPEWKSKLERPVFADDRIAAAISRCQRLFGTA